MTFSQILLPLDGSLIAESTLPYARALAAALKLPIKLLSVIETSAILGSGDRERRFDGLVEQVMRGSEDYLREIARSMGGLLVEWRIEQGNAADVIIQSARKDLDALIAMATHGRSGVKRWLLGSVAEKVLRASANPLLLVKAPQGNPGRELPLRSMIVPLDGSELAETPLPTALEMARSLGIELLLVRASEIPVTAYWRTAEDKGVEKFVPIYEEVLAAATEEARAYLETKAAELRAQGVQYVRTVLPTGPAADAIVDLARHTLGSLIIMCTHGRSGVARWVLGSVTDKVVHHCASPVLVLRPALWAGEHFPC